MFDVANRGGITAWGNYASGARWIGGKAVELRKRVVEMTGSRFGLEKTAENGTGRCIGFQNVPNPSHTARFTLRGFSASGMLKCCPISALCNSPGESQVGNSRQSDPTPCDFLMTYSFFSFFWGVLDRRPGGPQ